METFYSSKCIGIDGFLDKLKSVVDQNVYRIVFIDGDQIDLRHTDWIYADRYVKLSYHIFVVIGSRTWHDKGMRGHGMVTYINAKSGFRDAADCIICNLVGQAYAYSRMTGVSFEYTLVSNDHFIFSIYEEYTAIGQLIDYIDPKSNRLDLCLLLMTDWDELSWRGQAIYRLMTNGVVNVATVDVPFKLGLIFKGLELKYPIEERHIMIELERQGRGLVAEGQINWVSKMSNWVQSGEVFGLVKDALASRGQLYVSELGHLFPLNGSIKGRFGVKNWHQLINYYPLVLMWLNAKFVLNDGAGKIVNRGDIDELDEVNEDEYLKVKWQAEWLGTDKQFCDEYGICRNDFTSWICGRRLSNYAATYAIKKWILSR